jgi:hypothetical protein
VPLSDDSFCELREVLLSGDEGLASKVPKPPTTIWNQDEECEDSTLVSWSRLRICGSSEDSSKPAHRAGFVFAGR